MLAQHRLECARLTHLGWRTYRRADWQICPSTPSDACQMRHMYSFNHNSNSYVRSVRLRGSLADMARSNSRLHYSALLVQSLKNLTLGSVGRCIEKSRTWLERAIGVRKNRHSHISKRCRSDVSDGKEQHQTSKLLEN